MAKTLKPVPVFGLKEDDGHEQADPSHAPTLPSPRAIRTVEDIKNMLVNGGLETYELVQEIKRLVRIGAIPLTPKNVSLLTKAERDCSEVLLGQTDANNATSKSVVLQIIQNLNNEAEPKLKDVTPQPLEILDSKPTEEVPTDVSDKLARFRQLKDTTIDL